MHIKSVEFSGAIGQIGQAPPTAVRDLAKVAFSGRSNVGKSSLINQLLGRTRTPIARVSQAPGKTQEINFYRVVADAGEFCLVDLPGYGYAQAPESVREKWRPLIEGYISGAEGLAGVVQLIDIRHGPTRDDLRAVDYLGELELPVLFALTKSDKLKPTQRRKSVAKILDELGISAEQAVAVSSLSGEGIEVLRDSLGALLFASAETDGASEPA